MLTNDWKNLLNDEFTKDYFIKIKRILQEEYENNIVFPKKREILKALELTSYKDTKVVILGQDPYPSPGHANGLAFSVKKNINLPGSLRNIYKELVSDIKCHFPNHGDLTSWAKNGVLLLNASLTVRSKEVNSHSKIGWNIFTDEIIKILSSKEIPIVFILWGKNAQMKKRLINTNKHFIIESTHPSPLSAHRGFFGTQPFSRTNEILKNNNIEPINWVIE